MIGPKQLCLTFRVAAAEARSPHNYIPRGSASRLREAEAPVPLEFVANDSPVLGGQGQICLLHKFVPSLQYAFRTPSTLLITKLVKVPAAPPMCCADGGSETCWNFIPVEP